MNREDQQRVIGKIIEINSDRFTVELLSDIDNFNINAFDDIHYFAQINSYVVLPFQNYYIVAEVYGIKERDINKNIDSPSEQFLNKVNAAKFLEVLPIGTLKPQSKNSSALDFDFGVSVYPPLYNDVLYIKEAELDAVFDVNDESEIICETDEYEYKDCPHGENRRYHRLSIGNSTVFPDYNIKIDIDKFFGNHSAILGNTGSGKSCTIASMLQGLFKFKNYSATGSTFILFDINGEYKKAFSKVNSTNNDINTSHLKFEGEDTDSDKTHKIKLPHWFLNFEEWALLLQATEKTQQPVLRNALTFASLFSEEEERLTEIKNHIVAKCALNIWLSSESPVTAGRRVHSLLQRYAGGNLSKDLIHELNFDFQFGNFKNSGEYSEQDLLDELNEHIDHSFEIPNVNISKFNLNKLYDFLDFAILYEESFGNHHIRDYCSSLLTRAKIISERDEYSFLRAENETIDKFIDRLLGLRKNDSQDKIKNRQVILIDLHEVEDDIVEIISCVLTRILYETVKKFKERNIFPINLVLEEAHRYIGEDIKRSFLRANKIFNTVAKEGRKFGLLLTVASQRPSELSKTVLSQCSNFIVHRIQNPEDLYHIKQITPHISETILKRMPSIPTQTALIFGHSVNLPATFRVNDANPLPKSENNQISKNWFKPTGYKVSL